MDKPIPEAVLDRACAAYAAIADDCMGLVRRKAMQAALTAAQQQGQAVDRERTLTAARFRAACYALKDAVEGPTGGVWRSESGERLKDRPEWVAFYNLVSDMRERGGPDPYAQPTQQGGGEAVAEVLRVDEGTALVALFDDSLRVGSSLYTAPPSAPVGVEGLPQPFGYVEPRHDLSGYEVFDAPGPRRAAIWNMHGMRKALAQTRAPYSIDADADGIRARVADAITGALAFGAQGTHKPPAGHWLEPFWDMARADAAPPSAPVGVGERQALANVPFGWVKDAPSGIRSTLDFTTLPGVAEGWRVEGYRVVTLYSLPYLRQQPSAVDEAGGDDA